jgi:ABC-type transport system involved in multi-copper enzyme maturation permease subunit
MRTRLKDLLVRLKQCGLPLLGKELIEQAARKRTYVIRVAYATMLFFIAFLFFFEILSSVSASPLSALGRGKEIVSAVIGIQFAGVYFFMPAMTCGVITQEKERDSLQLLFLTRLGPWAIVFEKLLGRMVPMLGFLLLSLPLLAFAYTLGGVSPTMLWTGVWMLVVAIIQVGTLALMCSAFFRSTVAAFVTSYILMFVMFFGPYFLCMVVVLVAMLFEIRIDQFVGRGSEGIMFLLMFPFFAPPIYFLQGLAPGLFGFVAIGVHSAINLGVSGFFLFLARRFLVSRAFVPSRNLLLNAFKSFDRPAVRRVPSAAPAAVPGTESDTVQDAAPAGRRAPVFSDDSQLPGDAAIIWRETQKGILGNWRYIRRFLLIVETPVLLYCGLMIFGEWYARWDNSRDIVDIVVQIISALSVPVDMLLWCLMVLVVSVKSASMIAGERSRQTLDVLSTTPLTGRQILFEKMYGIWQIIAVSAIPLFPMFLFKAARMEFLEGQPTRWGSHHEEFGYLSYIVCQALSMAILLPLVAWMSLFFGLIFRTQGRAIMASMAAIVVWSIAPLMFITMPLSMIASSMMARQELKGLIDMSILLSPAAVVVMNEANVLKDYRITAWGAMAINFAMYGGLLYGFRWICLSRADRWLGRLEAESSPRSAAIGDSGKAKEEEREERGGLELLPECPGERPA